MEETEGPLGLPVPYGIGVVGFNSVKSLVERLESFIEMQAQLLFSEDWRWNL